MKVDALILAGNRKGYMPVGQGNKALIDLMGRPVIDYVIETLETSRHIDNIYIVGPVAELSFLRERHPNVTFFQQGSNIVENVLSSYDRISPNRDRHILVTTSDIPFVRPSEVDGFISSSGYDAYDIVIGVASETALKRFSPINGKPGFITKCCHFKQGPVRLNNMFIMRYPPEALAEYTGILYSLRYQKKLSNFVRLMLQVVSKDPGKLRLIWTLIFMQATLQADRLGLAGVARAIGSLLDIRQAEATASRAMGVRLKTVLMDYGGAVMDIDNEDSLNTVRARFEEFMALSDEIKNP